MTIDEMIAVLRAAKGRPGLGDTACVDPHWRGWVRLHLEHPPRLKERP